jgi:predicted ATPase
LSYRSIARWTLGYPEAALGDAHQALIEAREIDQALTLMPALQFASITNMWCGNYDVANTLIEEVIALAGDKGAAWWKTAGTLMQGILLGLTNQASKSISVIVSLLAASKSGTTIFGPWLRTSLARAHAELGQIRDASRYIDEAVAAINRTNERWCEVETLIVAAEIAVKESARDLVKAEEYVERALAIARQQQAKSWELRAAMSLARLWRDQGKVQQARELLVPVYGWFTEGFDTRDLKEAKARLQELAL